MTEYKTAQQQFADRLRSAVGKQGHRRLGSPRRGASTSSNRSFAHRLRRSLDVR